MLTALTALCVSRNNFCCVVEFSHIFQHPSESYVLTLFEQNLTGLEFDQNICMDCMVYFVYLCEHLRSNLPLRVKCLFNLLVSHITSRVLIF
jgi:hypothetical protein